MPNLVVVICTQFAALVIGGLLVWGIVEIGSLNNCIVGGRSFCVVDSVIVVLMSVSALVLAAFMVALTKAYRD